MKVIMTSHLKEVVGGADITANYDETFVSTMVFNIEEYDGSPIRLLIGADAADYREALDD